MAYHLFLLIPELGNPRGNENPFLLTFGIFWYRWHNVVAKFLRKRYGPDVTGKQLFIVVLKFHYCLIALIFVSVSTCLIEPLIFLTMYSSDSHTFLKRVSTELLKRSKADIKY